MSSWPAPTLRFTKQSGSGETAWQDEAMTGQSWEPDRYETNARFVSDLGAAVVELLAPRPGERILDLGCGDGVLTRKIADIGCDVVAVDSSAAFIESARKLGLVA